MVVLLIFFFSVQGQPEDYNVLLDSAKNLFKDEVHRNGACKKMVSLLERSIELNPESSEARYFLAYAYSRLNSRDGRGIPGMNLNLVYKF